MPQTKLHHFIPVRHLARFSNEYSGPSRQRRIAVYDKANRSLRGPTRTGNVAREAELYTLRFPDPSKPVTSPDEWVQALFSPAAKDEGFEIPEKADTENKAVDAFEQLLDPLEPGIHQWTEEERAPLVLYAALAAVGHPTAVQARTAAIHERMTSAIPREILDDASVQKVSLEWARGSAVLATLDDMHLTALELNQLSWRLLRTTSPPFFVLGDNALSAMYPDDPFGVGQVLDSRSRFLLPIDPQSCLSFEAGPPGVGREVELETAEAERIVTGLNRVAWLRARREVYARSDADLSAVEQVVVGEEWSDNSLQFPVREEALDRLLGPFDRRVSGETRQPSEGQ